MEDLEIEYVNNKAGVVAIAVNKKTGGRFILTKYANKEKAEILAPKLLFLKFKAPSTEFNRFLEL